MAQIFGTFPFTVDTLNGRKNYFLAVVHPGNIVFTLQPGSGITYNSIKGLTLLFEKRTGSESPNKTSIFALGITDATFEGKGTFLLSVRYTLSGEPDDPDDEIGTVPIVRVGGTIAPGNDDQDLQARYVEQVPLKD